MSASLVSVVLLTFNHKDYIRECIEGILAQKTSFDFEILIGEDKSTDGTREICQEYESKYKGKIKLFLRNREDVIYINGRPTGRYNFIETLKQSKSKYIALCEGDDYWTDKYKLQKQVDFLEKNDDYSLSFHSVKIQNADNELIDYPETRVPSNHETLKDLALKGNYINTVSVVFRNIIDVYPSIFLTAPFGDFTLFILLAEKGKLKFFKDSMAVYRDEVGLWGGINNEDKVYKTASGFVTIYKYFKEQSDIEIAQIFEKRIINFLSQIGIVDNPDKLSKFAKDNDFEEEIKIFQENQLVMQTKQKGKKPTLKQRIVNQIEKVFLKLIDRPKISGLIKNIVLNSSFLGLSNRKNVFLGEKVKIGSNTNFTLKRDIKTFKLGDNFSCRKFCNFLIYPNASLSIGNNVFLNNYCSINCLLDISIGDNTMLGEGVKIYDHNHKYEYKNSDLKVDKEDFTYGKVSIGSNCWIGSNVTILKGVSIGNNVIVGAGCLIYKSIPSNSVVKQNGNLLIESL